MKVYFEDGELVTSKYLPFQFFYTIDASKGFKCNEDSLDYYNEFCPNVIIYTNSLVALDNKYCWNEKLKVPELYIRAGEHMVFTRVDELTTRELRQGHNLMKMYMANEFGNL